MQNELNLAFISKTQHSLRSLNQGLTKTQRLDAGSNPALSELWRGSLAEKRGVSKCFVGLNVVSDLNRSKNGSGMLAMHPGSTGE